MSDVRGYQFGEFTPISAADLPRGVSRSALMEMRATGMSNKGIADALGIATWKVAKAIGDTPKEILNKIRNGTLTKARAAKAQKRTGEKKPAGVKGALVRVCEVYTLKGTVMHYCVDTLRNAVTVMKKDGNELLTVPFADCEAFALEIMDVLGEIGK